jgi:Cytochrome b5-like Heme/Steroid binding domain
MSDTKTYTYADVAKHTTKKDLFVVIHDKVYNASSFVDEHPYAPSLSPPFPSPIIPSISALLALRKNPSRSFCAAAAFRHPHP